MKKLIFFIIFIQSNVFLSNEKNTGFKQEEQEKIVDKISAEKDKAPIYTTKEFFKKIQKQGLPRDCYMVKDNFGKEIIKKNLTPYPKDVIFDVSYKLDSPKKSRFS